MDRILKKGMDGADVWQLKTKLVELGYLHAATHSSFGSDTKNAVKAFQKAKGLTVDGIVGEKTWAALFGDADNILPNSDNAKEIHDIVKIPTPNAKASLMCEKAALYIGHPYVWGASGQENPTDAYIKGRNQTAADAQRSIKYRNKLQSQGVTWMRCFDCSGFISFLLKEAGIWSGRKDCDGLWAKCVAIEKAQLLPGDLLLRGTDKDKTHIGLYIGNGWCIHAKGRDVGVVKEPIELSKGYWKYFGRWV